MEPSAEEAEPLAAKETVPQVVTELQKQGQWTPPTAEEEAPLVAAVPQVVASLQKKGLWEGVSASEVKVHVLRASIGSLTPPAGSSASPVVLKLLERDLTPHNVPKSWGAQQVELCVACHLAWSDAGVAPPVLALTTDFLVEPLGELRPGGQETLQNLADRGALAAKLHAAPTAWFTEHFREKLQEVVPLLKEEPLGSALYPIAAGCFCRGATAETLPPMDQVRTLMALLPRPHGERAEQVVNVHGDLWHNNIVKMPDGESLLIDFEQSCVASAVQDLREFSDLAITEAYLQAVTGAKPSQEELYALHLEASIASDISCCLRDLFWFGKLEKMQEYIARAPAFAALCGELRTDHVRNKAALDSDDCFSGLGL